MRARRRRKSGMNRGIRPYREVTTMIGRPMKVRMRRVLAIALLGLGAATLFSACSTVPPTYTDQELKQICERRGGWWRGDLIAGYCEYQLAQTP